MTKTLVSPAAIRLDVKTIRRVRELAHKEQRSVSAQLRVLVMEALAARGEGKKC